DDPALSGASQFVDAANEARFVCDDCLSSATDAGQQPPSTSTPSCHPRSHPMDFWIARVAGSRSPICNHAGDVVYGAATGRRFTSARKNMRVYDKDGLIRLVRDKALKFGDFTLASGKKATYYLDGKQVTLDSAGARLIAEGILELLGQPLPAAVGG